jgi:gamma-glutamylcyclotransferase (GGCT)/AIG2-like uncharacterized protein YtfP
VLHFAYGSNMDRHGMSRRCPGAQLVGCAALHGFRFIIMRPGYGNVVPARGRVVHGVLWRLTPRDLAALHAYEKVAGGLYRPLMISVVANGRCVRALVYVGRERVRGKPKSGYMKIVAAAARDLGLPPHYICGLARIARAR